MRNKWYLCRAVLVSVVCSGVAVPAAQALSPSPEAGDVFREYSWKPNGKYNILNDRQRPLPIEGTVDLADATRAELIVEIANAHLGFPDLGVQVNGGPWHTIPFPELGPKDPSPSLWFFHWYPQIAIPLSELRADGTNQILFRIGKLLPAKYVHPAWTPIYGASLRVHYDAQRKKHASGQITAPTAGEHLGDTVRVSARAHGANTGISRVEFIAYYDGLNPEGDGIWRQWHYTLEKGQVRKHLGTVAMGGGKDVSGYVTWETTWLPDQDAPMQVAARIVDEDGLVVVTEPVGGLTLDRRHHRVELVKPTDVPPGFTNCQYGLFIHNGPVSETLQVTGDLTHAVDARVALSGWNAPAWRRFSLNGSLIDEAFTPPGEDDGNRKFWSYPLHPITLLQPGKNTLSTVPGAARQMDVHWPGVAILIRYTTTEKQPSPPVPAVAFTNTLGMSFVRIGPGTFNMGAVESVPGRMWEEHPHPVRISRPHLVATTEVNQLQFETVMGRNPSHVQHPDWPATQVTWREANEFCRRLSKKEHRHYRLPTESEWEFAARAGSDKPYYTGLELAPWQANFDGRQPFVAGKGPQHPHELQSIFRGGPSRVGLFPANAWGLHDMHGNVWEWTADWYGKYPESAPGQPPTVDPRGASETDRLEEARVLRGGAWDGNANMARSTFRWRVAPETRLPSIGFRIVLDEKR